MGRKAIPVNQRAQPISFSLKPHLIEKIDDYCHDHRFNRSKFLMEAVTQYMLKNDMGYHADTNVMEMSLARRVVIGLNALQEANREGELIPKAIMDALRLELGVHEGETPEESAIIDEAFADFDDEAVLDYHRTRAGRYEVYFDGDRIATIIKEGAKWILYANDKETMFSTLREAKTAIETGGF